MKHNYNEEGPNGEAYLNIPKDSPQELYDDLEAVIAEYGSQSKAEASVRYRLGIYYINHGDAMSAMDHLSVSLYIRRKFYKEEDLRIREIYYALEQTTMM